jgi:hypothetical protein
MSAALVSPGLFQINAIVPDVEDGNQPLVIRTNGAISPCESSAFGLALTAFPARQGATSTPRRLADSLYVSPKIVRHRTRRLPKLVTAQAFSGLLRPTDSEADRHLVVW